MKNFTEDRLRELAIAMTRDHITFQQVFTSSLNPVFKNLEDGDSEKWSERQLQMCPNLPFSAEMSVSLIKVLARICGQVC